MSKRGHRQPERDNQTGSLEPDLFSLPAGPGSAASKAQPPARYLPPPGLDRQIRKSAEEAGQEWDRLDSQAMRTSEQIRREVGGLALTSEDIENEAVKAAKRQLAQSPPAHRPKKDRRHLSSGQKNIADSDKRVEAAYGKPGEDL